MVNGLFHVAIVEAARNPVLTELYVAFADSVHAPRDGLLPARIAAAGQLLGT